MKIKMTILPLVLASLTGTPAIKSTGTFQGEQKLIEPGAFHGNGQLVKEVAEFVTSGC
jgi:hypothetical protein